MIYSTDEPQDVGDPTASSEHSQHDLQQSMREAQKSATPSPTDSLNALAMVAGHQLHDRQDVDAYHQEQHSGDQDMSLQENTNMETAPQVTYGEDFRGGERIGRRLTRSASPSDAILIKRNAPTSSQTTPTSTTGIDLPYGLLSRPTE